MKLIIEDDEGRKTVVPFARDEISIGRLEGNTIRLTERNVSRHHARLRRESNSIVIEDLGSYNGIKVNGEKIDARSSVQEGDLIEIGDYDLAIEGPIVPADHDTNPNLRAPASARKTEATAIINIADMTPPAASVPAQPLSITEAPRLVGLSGAFWGQELRLQKTVAVVGRTNDGNDIVIDHPSISRRHARFQREGDEWKLYDLESANGFKVNNERYGLSAVYPGDIVELGHVKFRFTAADETFAPPPEGNPAAKTTIMTAAVPAAPAARSSGPSRAPLMAGVAIAVGVLAMAALLIVPRLLKQKTPDASGDDLCQKAQGAVAGQNWAEGIKNLSIAKQLGMTCPFPIESALATAHKNQDAQAALAEADRLVGTQEFRQALAVLEGVAADSIYAAEAKVKAADVKSKGSRQISDDARESLEHGRLDEAAGEIDNLQKLDPDSSTVPGLQKQLADKRREAAPKPPPPPKAPVERAPERVVEHAPAPTPPPAPPAPEKSAGPSLEDRNAKADVASAAGIAAIKAGDLQGGIEKLKVALDARPDTGRIAHAHRNIGIALAQANRWDEAIPHLRIFLKLEPDSPDKPRMEKMIHDYEVSKGK